MSPTPLWSSFLQVADFADELGPKPSELQLEVRPELVGRPDEYAVCVLVK
jgi:hypothetical protein